MKAVKRFDPSHGVRLVTFAVHWIKAEMHEYILRNWRIVKVATTKAQRKLFFNLRGAKKRLGWFTQQEINDVAADLNVSPEEVVRMEQRLNAYDASFDADASDDNDTHFYAPSEYLGDEAANPAKLVEANDTSIHASKGLIAAMQTLDERSQDIIKRRWLNEDKPTLHHLANEYGVSAERIRQIEANAMKKLKAEMLEDI